MATADAIARLEDLSYDINKVLGEVKRLKGTIHDKDIRIDQLITALEIKDHELLERFVTPSKVLPTFVLQEAHFTLYGMIRDRGVGRICNDLNPYEQALLTKRQWSFLAAEYRKRFYSQEEIEHHRKSGNDHMMDWQVLDIIALILEETYKEATTTDDDSKEVLKNCHSDR